MGTPVSRNVNTMLELKRISFFVEVANGKSLTRSAAHLHVSRSILSREIQALEQSLGRRLFHRTGRGMTLTEFGEQLLPHARALIDGSRRFDDAARGLRDSLSGTVTIGLPGSCFALLARRLLEATQQAYPDVLLRLVEGRSAVIDEMLSTGGIDIGLVYAIGDAAGRGSVPLSASRVFLVGPPKDTLTARRSVEVASLVDIPLLMPSRPHVVRTLLEGALSRAGHRLVVSGEIDSLPAQKELVAAGLGMTVCLDHAISEDVRAKRLQAAPLVAPSLSARLVMRLAPKNVLGTEARAVAKLVTVVAQTMVAKGEWKSPK